MALPVHLAEDGVAELPFWLNIRIWRAKKRAGDVSGAALDEPRRVVLAQEWSGVGYNEHIRLVGDFGGRLYYLD
jgi:hypothetical protein